MALKYTSFAELLQTSGNRGVGGNSGCKANVHAGLTDPTEVHLLLPLPSNEIDSGGAIQIGGDKKTKYPCGFQGGEPTVPTVPTGLQGDAHQESNDDRMQWNLDRYMDTESLLDPIEWTQSDPSFLDRCELDVVFDEALDAVPFVPLAAEAEDPHRSDPTAWRVPAAAYDAHHFNCPTCIAAGRGLRYGNRCKTGLQLWHVYTEQLPAEVNPINDIHPIQLIEEEHYEE